MRCIPLIGCAAILLAGCGSASSSGPKPTSTPLRGPVVHTVNLSRGTSIPVKKPRTGPRSVAQAAPIKKLPLPKPVPLATRVPIPAKAYTATLYGVITDAKTHSPLSGAKVVLDNPAHFARTDSFGHYSLKAPGRYFFSVSVSMQGYLGELKAGRITPHQGYRLNFALHQMTPGKNIAPPPPSLFGQH